MYDLHALFYFVQNTHPKPRYEAPKWGPFCTTQKHANLSPCFQFKNEGVQPRAEITQALVQQI